MNASSWKYGLVLGVLGALGVLGCGDAPAVMTLQPPSNVQVVEGVASPDELEFVIGPRQRNAVLAQFRKGGQFLYQSCSGTLVGDRVVLTAAHCVVSNYKAWLGGAAPQVVSPADRAYGIGNNAEQPLWLALAETIHLHPQAKGYDAPSDVAIVILSESVLDNCSEVIPIGINHDPLPETVIGEQLLLGGFGSTTHPPSGSSPIRYWSLVEMQEVHEQELVVVEAGNGFPNAGDSGTGLLRRFPDGTIRTLGIASVGYKSGKKMRLGRADALNWFFDEVLDASLVCGSVGAGGTCKQDSLVNCDGQQFTVVDCQEQDEICEVDGEGAAQCVCSCDANPYCEPDCPCDDQCPCSCDLTDQCDEGCACDPVCHQQEEAGAEQDDTSCALAGRLGDRRPAQLGWMLLGLMALALRRVSSCKRTSAVCATATRPSVRRFPAPRSAWLSCDCGPKRAPFAPNRPLQLPCNSLAPKGARQTPLGLVDLTGRSDARAFRKPLSRGRRVGAPEPIFDKTRSTAKTTTRR